MTGNLGLIGGKIDRSLSPYLHRLLHDFPYTLMHNVSLSEAIKDDQITAFNITAPYQQDAYRMCDEVDTHAQQTRVVNTVMKRQGRIIGFNTDAQAFITLFASLPYPKTTPVIIIGNGATSESVRYACMQVGFITITIYARHPKIGQLPLESLPLIAAIYVQTTSVATLDGSGQYVVDLHQLAHAKHVIDVNYQPLITPIITYALDHNIPCMSGLTLLVHQALHGCQHVGISPRDHTPSFLLHSLINTFPLFLIGMPGSGKSTLAYELSRHLNRPFLDLDDAFLNRYGQTPEAIITQHGETHFRDLESILLTSLPLHNVVIATGGGIIMREINNQYMQQNGIIMNLEPPLTPNLNKKRPLSMHQEAYDQLLHIRQPIYQRFAHLSIPWIDDLKNRIHKMEEIYAHFLFVLGA